MPIARKPPGTRALRRGRSSEPGRIYHITNRTADKRRFFADFQSARSVVAALRHESTADRCRTLAFVVMPDHLHWLLQLIAGVTLHRTVNNVKARSARAVNLLQQRSGPVWQRGFHDRAIRRDEDLPAIARYIVANPVRAGLVSRIGEYPHWDAVWL